MDGGIIILAFSVEHYPELVLRDIKAKNECQSWTEPRTRFQHIDIYLTFCRNCSLKLALRGFLLLRGTVGAAAVAAVASGCISGRDVGCLAPTIDVDKCEHEVMWLCHYF